MKSLLIALLFVLTLATPFAWSQGDQGVPAVGIGDAPDTAAHTAPAAAANSDESRFYAYLGEAPMAGDAPFADRFVNRLMPGRPFQQSQFAAAKFRPMLQWRHWANKRLRFLPAFLFCFAVSSIFWLAMGKQLELAGAACRQHFWRSLFAGIVVSVLLLFLARLAFLSEIGWPLGIVVIGLLQLVLVCGLSVSINLVGCALATVCRLGQVKLLTRKPALARGLFLLLGSLVIALTVLISAPMHLPPVGSRIMLMLALLGVGGLYRLRGSGSGNN